MESRKFIEQVEAIYQQALEAAKGLLEKSEDKYICSPDWEDGFEAKTDCCIISVKGVGLKASKALFNYCCLDSYAMKTNACRLFRHQVRIFRQRM